MDETTIVIADDHYVVRRGLRTLLESEPGFRIVGEANDGLEAVDLVERLQPGMLVLDLMMPGLNGLEVARRTRKISPRTDVVVLSMYANEAYVVEALRAGAKAYVLKQSTPEELLQAARAAIGGRLYLSRSISRKNVEAYARDDESTPSDPYDLLTNRERDVLHLAAQGCSSPEIADRLSISRRTVEGHRAALMRKLALHTQTDLVRYALQRGIVTLEG
ncbi:MAG: response regulator transcription factor [Chloroflexi bacterium]|nr:response regulator transcription factor [Chloroflexota bacterium]